MLKENNSQVLKFKSSFKNTRKNQVVERTPFPGIPTKNKCDIFKKNMS